MPEKREFVEVVLFPIINRELQKLKDSHIHIVECKIGEQRVWDSIILPEKQADNSQNRSEITEKRTLSGGKLLFLSNIVGDLTEVSIRILPIVLFLNCDLKMQMLVQSKERMHLSGTKCAFCDCNVSKKFTNVHPSRANLSPSRSGPREEGTLTCKIGFASGMERHGTACITGTDLRARSVAGRRSASMVDRSFGAMSVAGHPSASMVGGGLSARSAKLPKNYYNSTTHHQYERSCFVRKVQGLKLDILWK